MCLMKKIEELKPSMLNCNVFSVYDYPSSYTITELLCKFFEKINNCIDICNKTINLTEWLVNEGLSKEVAKKLEIWLEDGTLANLINETLFKELNDKINNNNNRINALGLNIKDFKTDDNTWNDAFEGAFKALPEFGGTILILDTIYIQKSINLHDLNQKYGVIKKVIIQGNSRLNNPGNSYNTMIVKQGNFDGVVLSHGSGMKDIAVSRDCNYTDTSDGIWVAGITCVLENVSVNDQGGDGIRIGSKKEVCKTYNCNIGRLTNVCCVGNQGWGIKICDDKATGINTSDANAITIISPDIRDNKTGGILFENCQDNQVYSPDCEVNKGVAGIKIGKNTGGISIYSPYTENHECTNEIIIDKSSENNIVFGYRTGGNNDDIVDLNGTNFILGKLGTKFLGHYLKNNLNMKSFLISDADVNGYYKFEHNKNSGNCEISYGGGSGNSLLHLKNNDNNSKFGMILDNIIMYDEINNIRVRPQTNTGEVQVQSNTPLVIEMDAVGVKPRDFIICSPYTTLPGGITYYTYCDSENIVKLVLVNSTQSPISLSTISWQIMCIRGRALH